MERCETMIYVYQKDLTQDILEILIEKDLIFTVITEQENDYIGEYILHKDADNRVWFQKE